MSCLPRDAEAVGQGRADLSSAGFQAWKLSTHIAANRSATMPNRGVQNIFLITVSTCPPSPSAANKRCALASSTAPNGNCCDLYESSAQASVRQRTQRGLPPPDGTPCHPDHSRAHQSNAVCKADRYLGPICIAVSLSSKTWVPDSPRSMPRTWVIATIVERCI